MNKHERFKAALINTYEPAKALALWVAVLVLLVIGVTVILYVPPLLKGLAHNAEASARNAESITGQVNEGATTLNRILRDAEPQVKEAMARFVSASRHADNSAATVDANLPIILTNLAGIGSQGGWALADIRRDSLPLVAANLEQLRANQVEMGKSLSTLTQGTSGAIAEIQETARDMRKSEGYRATFGATGSLVNLNKTISGFEPIGGKLGVTFDRVNTSMLDVNRISKASADKWVSLLNPPPCKGFGCHLKRGLETAFRFTDFGLRMKHELEGLRVDIFKPVTVIQKQP